MPGPSSSTVSRHPVAVAGARVPRHRGAGVAGGVVDQVGERPGASWSAPPGHRHAAPVDGAQRSTGTARGGRAASARRPAPPGRRSPRRRRRAPRRRAASTSRSSSRASSRASSASTARATVGQSAPSPSRSATSRSVRMAATGLRSSWRRVGHELALARADALQPAEHGVHRAGQAADLVAAWPGSGTRRCIVVAADRLDLGPDGLDRPQRPPHQPPRHQAPPARPAPGSPTHSARRTASTLRCRPRRPGRRPHGHGAPGRVDLAEIRSSGWRVTVGRPVERSSRCRPPPGRRPAGRGQLLGPRLPAGRRRRPGRRPPGRAARHAVARRLPRVSPAGARAGVRAGVVARRRLPRRPLPRPVLRRLRRPRDVASSGRPRAARSSTAGRHPGRRLVDGLLRVAAERRSATSSTPCSARRAAGRAGCPRPSAPAASRRRPRPRR